MRMLKIVAAAVVITTAIFPAFAMETMMAKKGELMMMMPDGKMGSMPSMDAKMSAEMMKAAKPMDSCVMMMMGDDGKMYVMNDMKMADGKMACETMMMMK